MGRDEGHHDGHHRNEVEVVEHDAGVVEAVRVHGQ